MAAMAASPPTGGGQLRVAPATRNALSLARVESAMARTGAGIGVIFFLQSLPSLLGQLNDSDPLWLYPSIALLVGGLLFTVVATVVRRLVRVAMVTFSLIFFGVLISWPFAVTHPSTGSPWIYYLITIATAMAAIGLPLIPAATYLVVIPLVYAFIRLTPVGGNLLPFRVTLDSLYAFILGGAILIIAVVLRAAAVGVDRAQATALERYSHAVRAHAMEAERVRVDAIVHDSVLTTLLYAARADTPEAQRLAVTMATNAIGHLRDAALVSPDDGTKVRVSALAQSTREAIELLEGGFDVTSRRLGTGSIPADAADAAQSAAVQAAVNSVNHAGAGVTRSVRMTAWQGGIQIVVNDDGRGFEPQHVPSERLGVRGSIIERMSKVGGKADVRSAPGRGTTITIRWPADSNVTAVDAILEPDRVAI
jgi:signal transduction histidine kinase